MRLKAVKTILAICLITIMTLTIVSPISKADGNSADNGSTTQVGAADIKSKNEVVYATLTAKGSINAVYVVNHFEINKGGSITDYGKYKSVLNLTESKPIVVDGDTVTLQADQENYYYQGNMETTDLPWIFDFSYNLDGVELSPQEIAGKTGKLDIHINIDKNENANATFFENYMLQVSLNLNADQCKNIEAPDATVAEAGNNKMLTFTVMPDRGADFQVTTDVNNFTMSGIQISAMPFSMNVDLQDTEDMIEDFNQLPDAIAKLNEGVGKLADGTQKLKNGANDLMNGSSEFKTGLSELKKNSGAITAASGQIKNALSTIASSLNTGLSSETSLTDLTKLPQGLTQLADGLKGISSGLQELKNGFSNAAKALDTSIQAIPDTVITKEQIDVQFPKANEEQRKLLDQLYTSYAAGQTVKGTYQQVKQAFDAVAPTIDTLTANIDTISGTLDNISSQIGSSLQGMDIIEKLGTLSTGLSDLSSNYMLFDKGLNEYINGVGNLADGYNQFHSGLSEFGNGVGEMNNGLDGLSDGTTKLNDEVSKMPDRMQEEIDKMMSEYDGSDFVPVSFVSAKNENTELVQFVLKCEGIELPKDKKATDTLDESKNDETIWDRFIALFK